MNDDASNRRDPGDREKPETYVRCGDFQDLLTSYATGELSEVQRDLVNAHVKKCAACRAALADITQTMDLLKAAGGDAAAMPSRLTRRHSARITRAFRHPLLGWIYANHSTVAVLIAVTVVLALVVAIALVTLAVRKADAPEVIPIEMMLVPGARDGQIAAPAPQVTGELDRVTVTVVTSPATIGRRQISERELADAPPEMRIVVPGLAGILVIVAWFFVRRRASDSKDGKTRVGRPPLE